MSLSVKSLNGDASFLLSFSSNPHSHDTDGTFRILIDPWISGASEVFHSRFSRVVQKNEACIASLTDIDEPDLIIISQPKTDHCHEQTLRTLPPGGKSKILAPPAAAKVIKGWKHFETDQVVTLRAWQDMLASTEATYNTPLPGSPTGEVTVAWVPDKKDIAGLHGAIGITYRPPFSNELTNRTPLTPPLSPMSPTSALPSSAGYHRHSQALSVIYSPHGCSYKILEPYTSKHLRNKAALPLTALLHCFDTIDNPWWLGGNICTGVPGGSEIARSLQAKVWISAHDADKTRTGIVSGMSKMQRYRREDVEEVVSPRTDTFPQDHLTRVLVLGPGEECAA